MGSFRQTREIIVAYFMENVISDEFVCLHDLNRSKNLELPYDEYGRFDLDKMDDGECLAEFRVKKRDLETMSDALQIPCSFTCDQGSVSDGMEGLCKLLRRLAYPCRYSDIILRFGRPTLVLSMVTNKALHFVYDTLGHRITEWNHQLLDPILLQTYADAVHARGAALENCFGFVDGTVSRFQGWESTNELFTVAIKFQSLALPNDIIAHMFGPVGKC